MAGPAAPMYFMQPPAGPAGPPHSHLVCGGCTVLLMYPQGASNVRCSRCGHVTPAPPTAQADASQIVCTGCMVLLSYPRGAQSVQCSMCQTVTPVPVYGHVVCGGCSITLMYPMGASSVKCSVCHFVTPAAPPGAAPSPPPASGNTQGGRGPNQARTNQTVVVENPSTLDDQGNEVANIAVGVKHE